MTEKLNAKDVRYYATGKRKTAIAKVWVIGGSGNIKINDKEIANHNFSLSHKALINKPLALTKTLDRYDIVASVNGGGLNGQAEAIMYGIAKALNYVSPEYRTLLKLEGLLSRDSRIVERKKYGKRKARKGPQYRKR